MFDYHYNGEQKHNLIVGQLVHGIYRINIVYEDFETGDTKLMMLTNIRDFFDEEVYIERIKTFLKKQLSSHFAKEYMDVKWTIPKYIQDTIMHQIDRL